MSDLKLIGQLTLGEVSKLLRRFTYKPNFSFGVYETDDRLWLKAVMYVQDSRPRFQPWHIEEEHEAPYISSYSSARLSMPPVRYSPRFSLTVVQGNFIIPSFITSEDYFWEWLRKEIIGEMEMHERDEWFKVDEQVIFDPHKVRGK